MKLELLAQVLQDAGLGTVGTDIFVHRMDEAPATCILLRNPLDGIPTDLNLPDYYKSDLQAIVRCNLQEPGDILAKSVTKALTMFNRRFTDISGALIVQVKSLYPVKLPIIYPRSDGRGIEWSLNFRGAYVLR